MGEGQGGGDFADNNLHSPPAGTLVCRSKSRQRGPAFIPDLACMLSECRLVYNTFQCESPWRARFQSARQPAGSKVEVLRRTKRVAAPLGRLGRLDLFIENSARESQLFSGRWPLRRGGNDLEKPSRQAGSFIPPKRDLQLAHTKPSEAQP